MTWTIDVATKARSFHVLLDYLHQQRVVNENANQAGLRRKSWNTQRPHSIASCNPSSSEWNHSMSWVARARMLPSCLGCTVVDQMPSSWWLLSSPTVPSSSTLCERDQHHRHPTTNNPSRPDTSTFPSNTRILCPALSSRPLPQEPARGEPLNEKNQDYYKVDDDRVSPL